ncbi:MAG: hypothetical protein ACOX3W_03855 [Christensenellaceae bacterium]
MKTSKKYLALLIAILMVIGIMPLGTAKAVEYVPTSGDNWEPGVTSYDGSSILLSQNITDRSGTATWDVSQEILLTESIEGVPAEIAFVLDISGSMAIEISPGVTRAQALVNSAYDIIDALAGSEQPIRISITVFSEGARTTLDMIQYRKCGSSAREPNYFL